MIVAKINELKTLYSQSSKHSNYQILSKRLSLIIGNNKIKIKSRYEVERLKYILKYLNVNKKTIADIGGNTGFFSFELIDSGAEKIYYYEGNKTHADFVSLAANVLNIENKIEVANKYFSFENDIINKEYDIILLLNVLHHVGDDFGNEGISIEMAKQNIIKQLNSLADKTSILIFQLGFNWKGNRNLGLFKEGTKKEMIDFISEGVKNYWTITKIGIAEPVKEGIEYFDINDKNVIRNDQLGEFLNRPIFILKPAKQSHV